MKKEEVETLTAMFQEFGVSREEAVKLVNDAIRESHSVDSLSKKKDNSLLIKLGLLLIAFPDPTVSDLLGTLLISAGLVQKKMKRSTLHIEDLSSTFRGIMKDLQTVGR